MLVVTNSRPSYLSARKDVLLPSDDYREGGEGDADHPVGGDGEGVEDNLLHDHVAEGEEAGRGEDDDEAEKREFLDSVNEAVASGLDTVGTTRPVTSRFYHF